MEAIRILSAITSVNVQAVADEVKRIHRATNARIPVDATADYNLLVANKLLYLHDAFVPHGEFAGGLGLVEVESRLLYLTDVSTAPSPDDCMQASAIIQALNRYSDCCLSANPNGLTGNIFENRRDLLRAATMPTPPEAEKVYEKTVEDLRGIIRMYQGMIEDLRKPEETREHRPELRCPDHDTSHVYLIDDTRLVCSTKGCKRSGTFGKNSNQLS
jgi:hypothetical protein